MTEPKTFECTYDTAQPKCGERVERTTKRGTHYIGTCRAGHLSVFRMVKE